MNKISNIITIIGLALAVFCLIGFISAAYGSDQNYEICLNRCYLNLPDLEECISDDTEYWKVNNINNSVVKRSCKKMIRNEKIDCQINCNVAKIRFVDKAVKYYHTDVKNFPLTNE